MKTPFLLLTAVLAFPGLGLAQEADFAHGFADDFTNPTGSNAGTINFNIATRQKGPLAPIEWEGKNAHISKDSRFFFVANRGSDAWAVLDHSLNDTPRFDLSFLLQPDADPSNRGKLDLGVNFGVPTAKSPGSPFTSGAANNALTFQRIGAQLRTTFTMSGSIVFDEFLTAPTNEAFKVYVRGEQQDGVWLLKFAVPEADGFVREQVMPSGWTPEHLALFARNGRTPASQAAVDEVTLNLE